MSSYSFSASFIITNSLRPIFESIKALEIRTFMLFNSDLLTIQLYYVFFLNYLIKLFNSCSYYTIFFNPIAELVIPIRISSKEAKAKIEMYAVVVEAVIKRCSI